MYAVTSSGEGIVVRPVRAHDGRRFATVRTESGAWVSGELLGFWEDEREAQAALARIRKIVRGGYGAYGEMVRAQYGRNV